MVQSIKMCLPVRGESQIGHTGLSIMQFACEMAIEMALDKPLWGLLAASGATHWSCMPNNDDDDEFALQVLLSA